MQSTLFILSCSLFITARLVPAASVLQRTINALVWSDQSVLIAMNLQTLSVGLKPFCKGAQTTEVSPLKEVQYLKFYALYPSPTKYLQTNHS